MAQVTVRRSEKLRHCDNCNSEINTESVMGNILFPHCKGNIVLCEDCLNDLNNDIADEYTRFCDMGK